MNLKKFEDLTSYEHESATVATICNHIANGGSIIDLCASWDVCFWRINEWMNDTKSGRSKKYIAAINAQNEWAIQKILTELRSLSFIDISTLVNDDHTLKPVSEWPIEARRAVKEIQIDELFEGTGRDREQVGIAKKVKLVDKIKSIELMMKNLNMLTERTFHLTGTMDDDAFRDEFFGVGKKQETETGTETGDEYD